MAVYRRSARHRFILVLLVLTSVTLLTLDQRSDPTGVIVHVRSAARDALAPVQAALTSLTAPVGRFFTGLGEYGDLKAENERLRRQVEAAEAENLRRPDAERERDSLLALANIRPAADIPTVAARVTSNSPTNFRVAVEIDQGTASGVARGMPVATAAGLVGRVVEVSRRQATVLLVTDPTFNVGIRLTRSGDVGVARGSGHLEPLVVDLIDAATAVGDREVVVTSGLQQSLFPPGIVVGRVRSSALVAGALQKELKIDPVVDLRRLQYVRVLKWGESAR